MDAEIKTKEVPLLDSHFLVVAKVMIPENFHINVIIWNKRAFVWDRDFSDYVEGEEGEVLFIDNEDREIKDIGPLSVSPAMKEETSKPDEDYKREIDHTSYYEC